MRRSSIACWPARGTASAGAGTGWTSGGTATGPAGASRSATASRISGTGATGSSSRSTATSRTIAWSSRCSRPTRSLPDDLDALRATGYLARNFKLLSREKWMQDVVDHTGQAFLGVTLGCARCHDHMYDPILQKEYYQVRAIFEPHQVRIDRGPRRARHGQGRHPPRLRRAARRQDAPLRPRRRPLSDRRSAVARGPRIAGRLVSTSSRSRLPLTAIAPDRRQDVIRAEIDASLEALGRAEAALERLEADRSEGRRRARAGAARRRRGPGPTGRTVSRSSRPKSWSIRARRDRRSGRRRPRRRPRPSASWRSRRRAGPSSLARQARRQAAPARRAEADKALADALKAPGPRRGGRPSAAEHELCSPDADDLSGHQHGAPAGLRPMDRRRVQPADGPGGRQPHLGPPLRPGDRADGQRLRPQRPAAVATRRCSTGWPPS